jgi:cyanate permease
MLIQLFSVTWPALLCWVTLALMAAAVWAFLMEVENIERQKRANFKKFIRDCGATAPKTYKIVRKYRKVV